MNLKELLKQKIIEEVLNIYKNDWAILIYDASSAQIIHSLFTKTDLLSFNITATNHIEEDRASFDFPAIYFLSCSPENVKIINSEFNSKKYSSFCICSLDEPKNLNQLIKARRVFLNIKALEERVFICPPESLCSLSNVLGVRLSLNYIPCTRKTAILISDSCQNIAKIEYPDASLLLIDRTTDWFTPFVHFFTFKTVLSEISDEVFDDVVYKEIKYQHLGEINSYLQNYIKKLNRNIEMLNSKNIDTTTLGKMVLDAPKNIQLKEAVEKYAKLLSEGIARLEFLNELVGIEQDLVTGYDKTGKKKKQPMNTVFEFLGSTKYSMEDKIRLLYIIKAKGVTFTKTETDILKNFGYKDEDLKVKLNLINFVKREGLCEYKYDVSRFEPIVFDLIKNFLKDKGIFTTLNPPQNTVNSLRKSYMISCEKKTSKKILIVYFKNGLTAEECRAAYALSEALGVEIIIGGDKIISAASTIDDIKANKELREREPENS